MKGASGAGSPAKKPRARRSVRRGCLGVAGIVLALAVGAGAIYVLILYREIGSTFEGRLWAMPSRVYSAAMTLREGESVPISRIQGRLDRCGYRRVKGMPGVPGQYRLSGGIFDIQTREFPFPRSPWGRRRIRLILRDGRLAAIVEEPSGTRSDHVELEPEPVAAFYGPEREERTVLRLADYPKHLIQAVLAAEDQRYYAHRGVDPIGILRAMWENLRRGGVVQGGSTITQQTVKNIYLSHERRFTRKLKEAVMALILEARYSKEKILEAYFNEIYLGQRGSAAVCGFGEAAQFYFGKEVRHLDLAESAMLAGLIRAPAHYNPFAHPEQAVARKNAVIELMLQQGRISDAEARQATLRDPRLRRGDSVRSRGRHFVEKIRQELSRSHSDEDLGQEGLRIVTTLDTWMQEKAEEAVRRGLERLEAQRPVLRKHRGVRLEGCLIAMRPGTGEVLALVGGRDYGGSQFDRATQARRQPGSLFKPFVYATGFERGTQGGEPFTPATLLEDVPFTLTSGGREWSPQNYDGDYRGSVTAREALENSLNVPTIRAAMVIGLRRIVVTARAAGMGEDLKAYPSIALGAQEVVPIDAAAAFSIFANGGQRSRPYAITAVVDAEGHLVEEGARESKTVVSPQAAYLTLDLMRGVVDRGTAGALRSAGIGGDVAGKTGTTNDKRDAWFVGFRPNLLVLVWVGFDDGTETTLTGASGALPIWQDFMKSIGQTYSSATFRQPDGIVQAMIDPSTGGLATSRCPYQRTEIFIEGSEPQVCPEHPEGLLRGFWERLFGGHDD